MAISLVAILFGTIIISSVLGLWSTESNKTPRRYTTGEFAGEYDPDDIRGSYSFGDISNLFNIPLDVLAQAFAINTSLPISEFMCKDLEGIYQEVVSEGKEIGTDSVKIFVALYQGLSIEVNEGTYLPQTAINILLEKENLDDGIKAYLVDHAVAAVEIEYLSDDEEDDTEEPFIKGKTTFKEAISKGVSLHDIEDIVKKDITELNQSIRDFCIENSLSYSIIKEQIEAIIK